MAELRVLPTFAAEVQADVIDVLEECLKRARAGEIVSVSVAMVKADKMTISTRFSKSDCLPAMLGAISILTRRLTADCE
jgi:hypothetical protein